MHYAVGWCQWEGMGVVMLGRWAWCGGAWSGRGKATRAGHGRCSSCTLQETSALIHNYFSITTFEVVATTPSGKLVSFFFI